MDKFKKGIKNIMNKIKKTIIAFTFSIGIGL